MGPCTLELMGILVVHLAYYMLCLLMALTINKYVEDYGMNE